LVSSLSCGTSLYDNPDSCAPVSLPVPPPTTLSLGLHTRCPGVPCLWLRAVPLNYPVFQAIDRYPPNPFSTRREDAFQGCRGYRLASCRCTRSPREPFSRVECSWQAACFWPQVADAGSRTDARGIRTPTLSGSNFTASSMLLIPAVQSGNASTGLFLAKRPPALKTLTAPSQTMASAFFAFSFNHSISNHRTSISQRQHLRVTAPNVA
jgi:hypothetical protein